MSTNQFLYVYLSLWILNNDCIGSWERGCSLACFNHMCERKAHYVERADLHTLFKKLIDFIDVLSETDGINGLKRNISAILCCFHCEIDGRTSKVVTILIFALLQILSIDSHSAVKPEHTIFTDYTFALDMLNVSCFRTKE